MNYFWVNQGRTWKKEYEGNFLWAPILNEGGKRTWHWDTMKDLNKDDIVFSFVKGHIVSAAKVTSLPYNADKPKSFSQWKKKGVRCDVSYNLLDKPITIKDHLDSILPLLPSNRTPLTELGDGVQIYLTKIPKSLGNYFMDVGNQSMILYTKSNKGDSEKIDQLYTDNSGNEKKKTITVEVTRVVRDTKLSKEIKEKYDYKCQICQLSIDTTTAAGKYAEAAHIRPIEYNGDDQRDNIICLCPNHHTMLDYGSISINDDLSLVGTNGSLTTNHTINRDNLRYHRENIFNEKSE